MPPGKHSAGIWPGGAPDAGMEIVSWAMVIARPTNDNSRGITPPPLRWVLVNTVFVHQATSDLVEQKGIHRNAQNIQMKGSLPQVPGHRPRRKELRHALQSEVFRAPMFVI